MVGRNSTTGQEGDFCPGALPPTRANTSGIYRVPKKLYLILRLNLSVTKMLVIPDSTDMYKSFSTESRGYTCHFLLALATRHSQTCSATEVEGGCTCIQVSVISTTCCKKFNSMNIPQHCPSDFVAEPAPGYTSNIVISQLLQHKKEVLCCQCE